MKTAQSSSGRALRIGADGAIPWPHEKQPRARLAELIARAAVIAVTGGLASVACPVGVGRAHAADFYVNNSSASCSDAGPGTQDAPFCTISAALAAHHDPGTTINVMPGMYREQVTVPASGASGSPIILKALGSASQPVVVDGTDDFSDGARWAPYSGDVWLAASVSWAPKQVFADGTRLTPSTAAPGSLPARSFAYVVGSGLYVNAGGGNPGTQHQTQVGHRPYGFYASSKSWLTIDGFTVTRCEDRCIQLSNTSYTTVVGNVVTFSARFGMQGSGCTALRIASNVVSDDNDH